ncbi:MAG TPA: GIY-YIG nuclease family protein [Kofleriaceae bacterium]|nr:GIY-YIG nuclease family protein [Kofleriaceae bacterium]
MLTFNQLLRVADLDPGTVRLLRHRDSKPQIHRALYEAALALDPRFAQYQERQGTPQVIEQFRAAKYLAGFVVEPGTGATVFAGVWERLDQRAERKDNPFGADPPTSKAVEFYTRRLAQFDDYCGRLVIDWGDGTRAWVQRADNQDKPIVELRRTKQPPPFPGVLRFQSSLDQIEGLPAGWVEVLTNARGVYLLVRRKTGEQYVGSAYGAAGFFGRWLCYQDGHGGNVKMRELAASASEYDVTILEAASSDATMEDICARETLWKQKLGTRVVGLNRN